MPNEYIQEQVDISLMPESKKQEGEGIQITIGDLHGNAMKLMFMLVKHAIAENMSEENYNKLVEIYKTPTENLTENNLNDFNDILSQLEFRTDSLVRLIGDELADRGNNDYFTLKILELLHNKKVPVEILLSNHGIEFIEACEIKESFISKRLRLYNLAQSMQNLQALVAKNMFSREEILKIAHTCYKPTLKAISYSLSKEKKEITIYSHAGIGLNTIQSLAKKLNLEYKDATVIELAQTIDSINEKFQIHVQKNTVCSLYNDENMDNPNPKGDAPFEFIMWNRLYYIIDRPANHYGYAIKFVHGHDSQGKKVDNVVNLDNVLGKMCECNQGVYNALISMDVARTHDEYLIVEILLEIQTQIIALEKNSHMHAAKCASDLYATIDDNYQKLKDKEIEFDGFGTNCTQAINVARPELEKHRGWKQLLGNLALAIVGLGVFYGVAVLYNKATTGKFLFFKTNSADKLDKLKQTLESMKPKKQ